MKLIVVAVSGVWLAGGLAGCLADDGREVEDTRQGDTNGGDTSGNDTSVGDTGDDTNVGDTGGGDGSDTKECGDCDDKDPCTYDYCDESGTCQHVSPPAAGNDGGSGGGSGDAAPRPECLDNSECADEDPCTEDKCVSFPGECGVFGAYCVHEEVPGCGTGCRYQEECNDHDPCTDDQCEADGSCSNVGHEGCDSMCSSEGIVSVADIASGNAGSADPIVGGDPVKTLGVIGPWTTNQACNDGPTCDCIGAPAVIDDGASLGLRADLSGGGVPAIPEEPAWQCETHGCTEELAVECRPTEEGVVYRLWGQPLMSWDVITPFHADAIALPPQGAVGLAVSGYCLDTTPANLTGKYDAVLESDGVRLGFVVKMLAVDQGVIVDFEASECLDQSCPDWAKMEAQSTLVEEGDGQIGLQFEAPSSIGKVEAHARLFSQQSTLAGRWERATFGLPNGVAIPLVGGQLVLTRRGTGSLPQ